jgi:catechol 2,3-dioxygenase-like lactoylglutathione lyase family enzyme
MPQQHIAQFALIVADYDEAIDFYTQKLNFRLLEDTVRSPTKRWVRIAPPGHNECAILLAKAVGEEQISRIGNQTGGRVFLFLYTDDFWRDYRHMEAHGIEFIEQPREEEYGTVIVFKDLYGNLWDFIQPAS